MRMQTSIAKVAAFALLVCCFLGATCGRASSIAEELPSRNLMRLADKIRHEQKPQQMGEVFDAFEDYVRLHRLEAGLASGSFGRKLSELEEDSVRKQINQILGNPFVRIINESLFSLFPHSNEAESSGAVKRTNRLSKRLQAAVDRMGLENSSSS